jgi:hypothetical protein
MKHSISKCSFIRLGNIVNESIYSHHPYGKSTYKYRIFIEIARLNRLACLSLGSVPPGTPTMAMEILLNLKPLDLEMHQIAIKTYARIQNRLPHI